MNQASGWYKARAQTWAFVLGLVIAVIFHIDTLHITHQLWREPTLRAVIVANAQSQGAADQQEIANIAETFESLAIPVGWSTVPLEDRASCVWPPKAVNKPAYWSVGECRELTNLPAWGDGGAGSLSSSAWWSVVLRPCKVLRSGLTF